MSALEYMLSLLVFGINSDASFLGLALFCQIAFPVDASHSFLLSEESCLICLNLTA